MQKRIGIITIYGLENYGNRLQNYAVHKTLKDMGFNVKTYAYKNLINSISKQQRFKRKINIITKYHFSSNPDTAKINNHKVAFYEFTNCYIPTEEILSLNNLSEKADYFVVGSDQVWNPSWYNNIDKELFLLTFARNEQKNCLAPSFGIDSLPNEWKMYFKDNLKNFPNLSVREKQGARIIKELTGINAEVLIDPTLMIDSKDWLKIAKRPKNINIDKPYVLTYFLGNIPQKAKNDIKSLSIKKDFNVYNLMQTDCPDLYTCGPSEFIYLFSRASIIFTDSFHACVFSFLFSKPFIVYKREDNNQNMFSRIEMFLKEFDLERKQADSNLENEIFECDYIYGKKKLAELRKKEIDFLKNSFNK